MNFISEYGGRRAISPVIAALMLSAVVLAVGGAVWAFSQGAMTVVAEGYVEGINVLIDEISERFIVEHVAHNDTHVRVWVYNYGEVGIVVGVYADIEGGESESSMGVGVGPQGLVEVCINLVVSVDDYVAIKAVSRRGNNAYYRYMVPQGS